MLWRGRKIAGLLLISAAGDFGGYTMRRIFRRFAIIASAFLAFTFATSGATWAATVNYSGGKVTGITALLVGTDYFDIAFIGTGGDSYNAAYGASATEAYANGLAIVFAIVARLNAENPIPNISGSLDPNQSAFQVPNFVSATEMDFDYGVGGGAAYVALPGFGPYARTDTWDPQAVWTLVTATTPLPATLPLFASGLGAMGLLGWRRKRKAQAAA